EFINTNYKINTNSHLILWQIGVVGVKSIIQNDKDLVDSIERKIAIFQLQRKLLDWYNETHPIVLYVASIYPQIPCEKFDICLSNLDKVNIPRLATAYIKPDLIP
ncbi:TPA: hypothetical protein U6310_002966, partial [Legionella pneumophila]|nr:hypothetical protein [Legionella pneumophila]